MSTETQRPNGELSDVGLMTNDYTDHDEDPDVSSVTINATGNNVNTEYGADFPTPTGNPTVGADLQEFRAGVIEFDSGQTGTPQARIELWENGSLIRAGSDANVSVYAVLSFPWNANELATADGSLVQMKVIGTKSGGGPSARNTVRIGHMEWNVDYTLGGTTFFQTLNATAIGSAELNRQTSKTLAATALGNAELTRQTSKTLGTTVIGVAGLTPATLFTQALNATAIGIAGLSSLPVFGQILNATAVGVAGLVKKTSKVLNATALGTSTLVKSTKKTLAATVLGVAGLDAATLFTQTLNATALAVAGLGTSFIAGGGAAANSILTFFRRRLRR